MSFNTSQMLMSLIGLDGISLLNVLYSGCTYTGSSRAIEWAKRQIEVCKNTHNTCKSKTHPMPDRLLYLGQGDANEIDWLESDVKLYESSGQTGLYATLSHRWGTKQPLRLLAANLAEFRTRIPWYILPKTFQQAVNFARRLRIQYLWVDTLCIIQDSREDWMKQSVKMAAIYEHSFITLAASVAEHSDAGCFNSPSPFLEGYITDGISKANPDDHKGILDLVRSSNRSAVAFVRGVSQHPMPSEHLPLLTRGWVFQERLLSPRLLHFAHVDLIYECSQSTECYCKKQQGATSRNVRSHPPKLQHANALGIGMFKGVGGHLNAFAERWCAVIEEYSALHLTYASDRLPAIAGLAKQMARYMPEARYISGIWTQHLVVYLSWRRRTNPATANGPRFRSGPSWTWVTMPGAVAFPGGSFYLQRPVPGFREFSDPWPAVVGVMFDQTGEESFMSLEDGIIALRGVLVPVRLQKLQGSEYNETGIISTGLKVQFASVTLDYEPKDDELRIEWNDVTSEGLSNSFAFGSSSILALQGGLQNETPLNMPQCHWQNILRYKETMWAFCLGTWEMNGGGKDQYLLLERVDESSNTFRRIGQGDCAAEKSLFSEISERQIIMLK